MRVGVRAFVAAGVLVLSACVSVLPEQEVAEALYRIDAPQATRVLPASVIIREPESPRIFGGQAMVVEDATGAVRLVPTVEWADPVTRMVQLALVESFAATAQASAVLPETGASAPYEVSVRLQSLGIERGQAVCRLSGVLMATRSRALLAQEKIETEAEIVGETPADKALALKLAAEACVSGLSDFVVRSLSDAGKS